MSPLFRATGTDFDRLYRDHAASVYRYAFAVLGNHPDAEDVTQQTFLNAYRAIAQGTKPRKAENWLVRIAHNEVRRHFRTNGKAVEVELDDRLAHPDREHSDPSLADVLRALQKLTPAQRSALVMREFEGRSYAEIADALEITQSALEALLFRARRALAEHLEGALSCAEAEHAVSRRLDGRLPRREGRRLRRHLQDCAHCVSFVATQKRQRALLKGLSVMPVPASLFLFRPEPAAAAGLGATAAATAGGSGAIGLGAGLAAKAATVAAVAAVAGGVGYSVTGVLETPVPTPRASAVAATSTPATRRARVEVAKVAPRQIVARAAVKPARRKAKKAKLHAVRANPQAVPVAKQQGKAIGHAKKQTLKVKKVHPAKPTKAKLAPGRARRAKPPKAARVGPKKPPPATRAPGKPKPPDAAGPPPPPKKRDA